jgi:hypothetical protein
MGLLPNAEGSHVVVMEVSVHIRVHMATRVTPRTHPTQAYPSDYKVVLAYSSDYKSCIDSELVYNTKCR